MISSISWFDSLFRINNASFEEDPDIGLIGKEIREGIFIFFLLLLLFTLFFLFVLGASVFYCVDEVGPFIA